MEQLFLLMWCGEAGEEKEVIKIKMMLTMMMMFLVKIVLTTMMFLNEDVVDVGCR